MRLLHVTDLHFRPRWFAWVAAQAKNYDAVCLSGDLVDLAASQTVGRDDQLRWVLDWLGAFPGQLFVTSGNHDGGLAGQGMPAPDGEARWLHAARRPGVAVDGDVAFFSGWRLVLAAWSQPFGTEGLEPVVMLSHAPPERTAVSTTIGGWDHGDFEVRGIAERLPWGSLILSGHVHHPCRWHDRVAGTLCLNPGADFTHRQVPNHIVIDLGRRATRAMRHTCGRTEGPLVYRGTTTTAGPSRWSRPYFRPPNR